MPDPGDLSHPRFARAYARMAEKGERRGVSEHRRRLLAGLHGRVLEVGAGSGLNFAHYPPLVQEVVAIEPEPTLRERAQRAADDAAVTVSVVPGRSDPLPFEGSSFDAAVVSLVLCSVPDQGRALAELHRVVRPGGELRFYEHVAAHRPPLSWVLRFASRTFWPLVAGGCHPDRETAQAITGAGFSIESCDRFAFSPSPFQPKVPHILGLARRPA